MTVLQTDRCTLRVWTLDDLDTLQRLLADPDVRRYLCDDIVFTHEQVAALITAHLTLLDTRSVGMWFVQLTGSEQVIGFTGFRLIDDTPDLELMYGLYPSYWGQGLATEASQAALDYLWRNTTFDRVYARTDPPNVNSCEVMKRLGMRLHSTTDSMISYVLARPGGR